MYFKGFGAFQVKIEQIKLIFIYFASSINLSIIIESILAIKFIGIHGVLIYWGMNTAQQVYGYERL